jgi:hypothetical protein
MTSATTGSATGAGGRHAEGRGYGLVLFASALLVIVGCSNLVYGIAAIANSHVFTANAHYMFGSLRTWGWITLMIIAVDVVALAHMLTRTVGKTLRQRTCSLPQRLVLDIITSNGLVARRASGLLASPAVSSGVSGR